MSQDKISIIGIGRLGVCAALQFANAGYDVLGCDINPSYVEKVIIFEKFVFVNIIVYYCFICFFLFEIIK